MKPTKVCAQCKDEKDIDQFCMDRSLPDKHRIICRVCDAESSRRSERRINPYRELGYAIAGGRVLFRALPKGERAVIREKAKVLHELGQDYTNRKTPKREVPYGFVYAITNPAWPGYVKIGMAEDAENRCRGYHTSGPFCDWEIRHAVYFEFKAVGEKEVLARFDEYRTINPRTGKQTEWVERPLAAVIHEINKVRSIL